MKKVNYNFGWGHEYFEGSIEVEDDTPGIEIDRLVIDDILSIGIISYNWTVESCDTNPEEEDEECADEEDEA